jgi:hypothetical protein
MPERPRDGQRCHRAGAVEGSARAASVGQLPQSLAGRRPEPVHRQQLHGDASDRRIVAVSALMRGRFDTAPKLA